MGLTFLNRLLLEKPTLKPSNVLGLAMLQLHSLCLEETINRNPITFNQQWQCNDNVDSMLKSIVSNDVTNYINKYYALKADDSEKSYVELTFEGNGSQYHKFPDRLLISKEYWLRGLGETFPGVEDG